MDKPKSYSENHPVRQHLEGIVNSLPDNYREVIAKVLTKDFYRWTGSSSPDSHHYGIGGLAQHTLEVVSIASATNVLNNVVGRRESAPYAMVVAAAIYHDTGKLWDYTHAGSLDEVEDTEVEWIKSSHARKIHHISRSALLWMENSKDLIPNDEREEVYHAILSHHGCREYGSPVSPATPLAWILHLADALSAKLDQCARHAGITPVR